MSIWEGISLAFQQIWSQKLKSFFSVLGVILGVMFLIVVVTVVEGLDRLVREDFSSQVFGVNTVTLRRWQQVNINTSREERRARQRRPFLYFADAEAIQQRLTLPARISVENNGSASAVGDNGRTATGVQLTGATPDIFLGWGEGEGGGHFYVRQLADMKGGVRFVEGQKDGLDGYPEYCGLCGWALARAHARSGDAARIVGYLGNGSAFDEAVVNFSTAYADQTERDHAALVAAVKRGKIEAITGR